MAGNYLDKVAHFLLFAFLTYQALKALIRKEKNTEIIIWAIFLGFLTEYLQQFIPGRNMDFYDALADSIGVFCAFYLYKYQYGEKK
ncbi:MAG: VanZ family protein [Saprospiraceae bacterium]